MRRPLFNALFVVSVLATVGSVSPAVAELLAIASKAATGAIQAIANSRPASSAWRPLPAPLLLAESIRATPSRTSDGGRY